MLGRDLMYGNEVDVRGNLSNLEAWYSCVDCFIRWVAFWAVRMAYKLYLMRGRKKLAECRSVLIDEILPVA